MSATSSAASAVHLSRAPVRGDPRLSFTVSQQTPNRFFKIIPVFTICRFACLFYAATLPDTVHVWSAFIWNAIYISNVRLHEGDNVSCTVILYFRGTRWWSLLPCVCKRALQGPKTGGFSSSTGTWWRCAPPTQLSVRTTSSQADADHSQLL